MLMILFVSLSWADRVYWLLPPSDEDLAYAAATAPGVVSEPLDSLTTGGRALVPVDTAAINRLGSELNAVKPLISEFDGELQIMSRLSKAAADVHALQSSAERDLLYEAELLAGFAVHRYFQAKLGTDPNASPYRSGEGDSARIVSWYDAAALYGVGAPPESSLPESAQRLAFDAVQAESRSMPSAVIAAGPLTAGAEVRVDGTVVASVEGTRVTIVPGRHFVEVRAGGRLLFHQDVRVEAGKDLLVQAPIGAPELGALRGLAADTDGGWDVPAPVMATVASLGEPVFLGVPGRRTAMLRLDSGRAVVARPPETRERVVLRGALGAGWSSTGDWFLQNVEAGAPLDTATVNAATPAFHLGAEARFGTFAAGIGADVEVPVGNWHTLPSGDSEVRPLVYPHAAVGLPWVQATVGPLFPWYLGLGLRAHIPIYGPIEAFGAGVYGLGVDLEREAGPAFSPAPLYTAWAGVAFRYGR